MEEHDGLVEQFREADQPLEGLGLAPARMADGVIFRCRVAARDETVGHPLDHAVVFGVGADQRAVLPGDRHHVQHLFVEQPHIVVGHEDLDGAVAEFDEPGEVPFERFAAGVRDPQVEGEIGQGAALGESRVIGDDRVQAVPAMLGGERNGGGGAPEGGRAGGGLEGVGVHDAAAGQLLDVAMGIDAARQDELVGGVDFLRASRKIAPEGDDFLAADGHIHGDNALDGADATTANHEIVYGQKCPQNSDPRLDDRSVYR